MASFPIGPSAAAVGRPFIFREEFGTTADGSAVEIFALKNSGGMEARIMTYGGIVVSLTVPDREGKFDDVVLGYDSLAEYERHTAHFGALIGRYANRIANAQFVLDGEVYQLAANNGPNHLHGGRQGFDRRIWTARPSDRAEGAALELRYVSADGEEGYPGNLDVKACYTLTEANELKIEYWAVADRDTIVNLTNHSYFNLNGAGSPSILDHELLINAGRFTPTDNTSIPHGELRSVEGTPFDFRHRCGIGSRIDADNEQLRFASGYDHNWVLNKTENELSLAASVFEPTSGRRMDVETTEPGIQFYSGNYLDASMKGKGGREYPFRSGLCLEAQHFPDSPNQPDFPSTVLHPGEEYLQTTVYRFSAE